MSNVNIKNQTNENTNKNNINTEIDDNINTDIEFNKTVKKLVNEKSYFTQLNPNYITSRRIVNINKHYFRLNEDYREQRANYGYYSYQFEKLLKDNNINTKDEFNVYKFFIKEKDNLSDLSWILKDYY